MAEALGWIEGKVADRECLFRFLTLPGSGLPSRSRNRSSPFASLGFSEASHATDPCERSARVWRRSQVSPRTRTPAEGPDYRQAQPSSRLRPRGPRTDGPRRRGRRSRRDGARRRVASVVEWRAPANRLRVEEQPRRLRIRRPRDHAAAPHRRPKPWRGRLGHSRPESPGRRRRRQDRGLRRRQGRGATRARPGTVPLFAHASERLLRAEEAEWQAADADFSARHRIVYRGQLRRALERARRAHRRHRQALRRQHPRLAAPDAHAESDRKRARPRRGARQACFRRAPSCTSSRTRAAG